MKAVRIHTYGGPEVLKFEDAPRPEPAPGEVLIKVNAAGVNPIDWKIRAGHLKDHRPYVFPLILGWDVSGIIEANGLGGTRFKNGDEVYARSDIARNGAYAEYIVAKQVQVAQKPKLIDHIHAASIPLAALTAWQALFDAAGLSAGQRVLIHGAAGGVGSFAVQLAKWKETHVIGTASARNQAFIQELGADESIDYTKSRFDDVLRDVDVVFDTVAGETQTRSWKVLKKGGILVSIASPPSAEDAGKNGVRQAFVFMVPNASQLAEIAKLVDSGKLKPVVETVLPLSDARRAHELSQTGHTRGKIVLRVD
ncbi:MAG TPA: NADP-dependent oxidoreductase [Candidatus Acidoferrales bacterium]|nr:NADP-dependent oxidoreductase [Candidatus Acidoferrales bacterium]